MNAGEAPVPVGLSIPQDSARLHVTGQAAYADDLPEPRGTLYAAVGMSSHACAAIRRLDLAAVRVAPGVVAVLTAADIPGRNQFGPIVDDDPILADGSVTYAGQPIFIVVADSVNAARQATALARVDYDPRTPIVDIDAAERLGTELMRPVTLVAGDWRAARARAARQLSGCFTTGSQEHFYLEGQIAVAMPGEDRQMRVVSSTQHPTDVQRLVAAALGVRDHDVVVECRRLGGGFGGKETQASLTACLAAVAAWLTGRPVKLRLRRRDDMRITGKRHDYRIDFAAGFADDGLIEGLHLRYASRCGHSSDLSGPVNDRTLFHADNAYFLPNVKVESHRLRTHTASSTAFRGFGGPQGMFGIEYVLDDIARTLAMDPLDVRRRNFYGTTDRNVTPYGMTVEDNVIHQIVDRLEADCEYRARRLQVAEFNASNPVLRKGLALTPLKFGIAFTDTAMNQAGALVNVYRDGTVMLHHGGTEMGQGLYTKVAQVVAAELRIPLAAVRCAGASTAVVPNTSATAASASSDLNGAAAMAAARQIRERLAVFAGRLWQVPAEEVIFHAGCVSGGGQSMTFAELANAAWLGRVSLSATGFYATPKIGYDRVTLTGRPFHYFVYGAAASEIVIDTLTGESRLLRVDILHDAGRSLNPAIDLGQIEGGFLQGVGWLTSEEVWWDQAGVLGSDSASTYKIPTATDWPAEAHIRILETGVNREATIYRSKGVGEPPLMHALSVFFALKDAVASLAPRGRPVRLDAPATPEAILRAVSAARRSSGPGSA